MIERNNDGLKVAYRDAPTEEQIKSILKKRKIARIINSIVFLILLVAAGYLSYKRYEAIKNNTAEKPASSEISTE